VGNDVEFRFQSKNEILATASNDGVVFRIPGRSARALTISRPKMRPSSTSFNVSRSGNSGIFPLLNENRFYCLIISTGKEIGNPLGTSVVGNGSLSW